jgi:hypothetical protein
METVTITLSPLKATIRKNAHNLRQSLDTREWPSVEYTAINYRRHLQDCIEYPTTARLAKEKYINKPFKTHSTEYWRNEQIVLNRDTETQALLKTLKTKLQKLYPTTLKAREYIIKTGRVDFETIKKAKGYNWLDRLRIALIKIK